MSGAMTAERRDPRGGRALRAPRRAQRPLQPAAARRLADACRSASARCCGCSRGRASPTWRALRVLEVGCGAGGNLLELLRLGFAPEHLTRRSNCCPSAIAQARARAAGGRRAVAGRRHAARRSRRGSQDIVLQSTVFSSLLDDAFQQRLADAMWRWVKPGGARALVRLHRRQPAQPRRARRAAGARAAAVSAGRACRRERVTLAPPMARVRVPRAPGAVPRVQRAAAAAHAMCWPGWQAGLIRLMHMHRRIRESAMRYLDDSHAWRARESRAGACSRRAAGCRWSNTPATVLSRPC